MFFPKSSQAVQLDIQDKEVHITSAALDLCHMSGANCDPNHVRRGLGLIQTQCLLLRNPSKKLATEQVQPWRYFFLFPCSLTPGNL